MAIKRFSEYMQDKRLTKSKLTAEHTVSKTLEFANDDFEIVINIKLSRHEQHTEAIRFLRRVADELLALNNATQDKVKNSQEKPCN